MPAHKQNHNPPPPPPTTPSLSSSSSSFPLGGAFIFSIGSFYSLFVDRVFLSSFPQLAMPDSARMTHSPLFSADLPIVLLARVHYTLLVCSIISSPMFPINVGHLRLSLVSRFSPPVFPFADSLMPIIFLVLDALVEPPFSFNTLLCRVNSRACPVFASVDIVLGPTDGR